MVCSFLSQSFTLRKLATIHTDKKKTGIGQEKHREKTNSKNPNSQARTPTDRHTHTHVTPVALGAIREKYAVTREAGAALMISSFNGGSQWSPAQREPDRTRPDVSIL